MLTVVGHPRQIDVYNPMVGSSPTQTLAGERQIR